MSITPEQYAVLRAPYTPQAVKFRLDAKKADRQGRVRCVVYIDASLAADRLALVDPAWSSAYTVLGTAVEHSPVLCRLTVNGVKREGVGQYAHGKADDKHLKSAFSDALKRAAVEFGVGAYLRSMPQFAVSEGGCWTKQGGDMGGLKDAGLNQLRQQYAGFIRDMQLVSRFGEPIDHGDYVHQGATDEVETEAMQEAAEAQLVTDEQAAILAAIAEQCGYPFDRSDKLAEDYAVHLRAFVDFAVAKAKKVDERNADALCEAALRLDVDAVRGLLGTGAVKP